MGPEARPNQFAPWLIPCANFLDLADRAGSESLDTSRSGNAASTIGPTSMLMGMFADPGPHEVSVTTGRCATAEERVGHVAGRLLVTRRDRPDGVGAIVERVEQPDVAVPAQAEDVRHLLAHQVLDDDLAAVAHGPSLSHCRLLRYEPGHSPDA
jgi:hypothetical protein